MPGTLYYGDNLDLLRRLAADTVDLIYIDPPFNSKRTYNQIYTRVADHEDRAQAQAFVDTWTWEERARDGYAEIQANEAGRFPRQTVELLKGLHHVLGEGSLLAYLVSMTLRLAELRRVLKPTGSFYLHCDQTASHYLKLVLDGIFCSQGGDFLNEVVWCYRGGGVPRQDFARKHDTIFRYSKGAAYTFNVDPVRIPYSEDVTSSPASRYDKSYRSNKVYEGYRPNEKGKHPEDWWPIQPIMPSDKTERLGYPTQKPEALLERIILASSNEGDVVLDAYCGCGTSVAVAERLKRKWIGMDITYQAIALIQKRLEDRFGEAIGATITVDGVPRDMDSALALAHKRDDRVRKEFEKWAVLTYTNNRGIVNDRRGADGGIDGTVYFLTGPNENASMVFQVKSGGVQRGDVAKLHSDMQREGASMATLITLEDPTRPMLAEARACGTYDHRLMGRRYDTVRIVTIREILEGGTRLDLPLSKDVLRSAERFEEDTTLPLFAQPETTGERQQPQVKKASVRPPGPARAPTPSPPASRPKLARSGKKK